MTNLVLTLSTGNATALKSSSEEINCLEARSVNFHTLSPISLKVEVLNQIKSSQCTMELCKKWQSYTKWQLGRNTAKAKKLLSLFIHSTCFYLSCAEMLQVSSDRLCLYLNHEGEISNAHRWCKHACKERGGTHLKFTILVHARIKSLKTHDAMGFWFLREGGQFQLKLHCCRVKSASLPEHDNHAPWKLSQRAKKSENHWRSF